MRIILSILFILCSFLSLAQNKVEKNTDKGKADQTVSSRTTVQDTIDNRKEQQLEALVQTISENRSTIEQLRNNLKQKNDTIKLLNRTIQHLYEEHNKEIDCLNDTLKRIREDINRIREENENLRKKEEAQTSLSRIVYKQCLLYPLERRYKKSFVEESMKTIEALNIRTNPKYKETCDTYWNLLERYAEYNNEVLAFLEETKSSFHYKDWKINDHSKQGCLKKLNGLPYFLLYKDKDREPYRSISYLDGVIDDFLSMLKGKETLNESNFQKLIDRVRPRE